MNAREPAFVSASRSARLRQMLVSNELEFMMEAHNGLSARIVREAGFKAIWGSGLAISAQYGVRDNNEASWTQVVDMLEFMADASDLPILLDGDTGYGNFNNVRRLVRKLEQRGIAGVCIEDKQFPKTNSFINGERQPLADIDEFCGKIKAGKDSQSDDELLDRRARRGVDRRLGHGRGAAARGSLSPGRRGCDPDSQQALAVPTKSSTFAREWAGRGPLVIVPTKYYSTPTDVFREAGISMVIWANHLIRARDLGDAGRRQGNPRERNARQRRRPHRAGQRDLPPAGRGRILGSRERLSVGAPCGRVRAVVLAASRGTGLEADHRRPSESHAADCRQAAAALARRCVQEAGHQRHHRGGRLSRRCDRHRRHQARRQRTAMRRPANSRRSPAPSTALHGDTVISYGDLLFRSYILRDLRGERSGVQRGGRFVADATRQTPSVRDFAYCSAADDRGLFGQKVCAAVSVERARRHVGRASQTPHGRWIGLLNVRGEGRERLQARLSHAAGAPGFRVSSTCPRCSMR